MTGDELSLPDVGVYKVTLDAYDCAGNTTKKTVTVYVNKETLQDSLTVSSEGKTIDAKDQHWYMPDIMEVQQRLHIK